MECSNAELQAFSRRLLTARMRLLSEHGFYGLLLMHMKFAVGDELDTAWVSRDTITFNPGFLRGLDDRELLFVLEHEVLHAALGHLERGEHRDQAFFNLACDIVVNSNIMLSNGMDPRSITVRAGGGESFHVAPDGREGYECSAEEVYEMLAERGDARACDNAYGGGKDPGTPSAGGGSSGGGAGGGAPGGKSAAAGDVDAVEEARACGRGRRWDWHVLHSGDEGGAGGADGPDDADWGQWLADACESMARRDPDGSHGLVPLGARRRLGELRRAHVDWRAALSDFVQEEVCDYSFSDPDRRFSHGGLLLPSFSDAEATVRDVLFMVDTSGSVFDEELDAAFSEVAGAIEQFDGKLEGWLGFFDAVAYEPVRFSDMQDLREAKPKGGGGTRLEAPFEAVERWLDADEVSCIVVMTDGYAPFPPESAARGIPALWLMTTDVVPPWGKVARMG